VFERTVNTGGTVDSFYMFPEHGVVLSMNANLTRFGIGKAAMKLLNDYIRVFKPDDLQELLEILREDKQVTVTKGVVVSTVHGAKGEEWDEVIMPGLDLFKFSTEQEQLEERRLAFVGFTRARKRLRVGQTNYRTAKLPGGRTITTPTRADSLFYEVRKYLEAAGKEVAS
jgi:superfamily I DNA/RNA helicase